MVQGMTRKGKPKVEVEYKFKLKPQEKARHVTSIHEVGVHVAIFECDISLTKQSSILILYYW